MGGFGGVDDAQSAAEAWAEYFGGDAVVDCRFGCGFKFDLYDKDEADDYGNTSTWIFWVHHCDWDECMVVF